MQRVPWHNWPFSQITHAVSVVLDAWRSSIHHIVSLFERNGSHEEVYAWSRVGRQKNEDCLAGNVAWFTRLSVAPSRVIVRRAIFASFFILVFVLFFLFFISLSLSIFLSRVCSSNEHADGDVWTWSLGADIITGRARRARRSLPLFVSTQLWKILNRKSAWRSCRDRAHTQSWRFYMYNNIYLFFFLFFFICPRH